MTVTPAGTVSAGGNENQRIPSESVQPGIILHLQSSHRGSNSFDDTYPLVAQYHVRCLVVFIRATQTGVSDLEQGLVSF